MIDDRDLLRILLLRLVLLKQLGGHEVTASFVCYPALSTLSILSREALVSSLDKASHFAASQHYPRACEGA